MTTFRKSTYTEDTQRVATFSGDGAYHGSTNRDLEETPVLGEKVQFPEMQADFANVFDIKKVLSIPSQESIRDDGVTFMWASFEEAKREAGPLTKSVLLGMEPHLKGDKKNIYIDSKIQFFHKNDLPVDSKLWHIDGSMSIRGERAWKQGYILLHDLKSKLAKGVTENYLAYQSSNHCATQWAMNPISIVIPECISSFDILDQLVEQSNPRVMSQPAGSIIEFNDNSLHRAVPASADGWRLWVRCIETNREIKLNSSAIECYGKVFRR